MDKWQEYEAEKKKLQEMALPPEEYERRLAALLDRLGL